MRPLTDDPPPADPAVDRPTGIVWIASYPRSGNTWTRTFLHNLFDVLRGGTVTAHDINRINQFTTWDISAAAYQRRLGKPLKDASRTEIAAARPDIQRDIADRTDGLALVKTHNALVTDRGVPTINFAVTSGAVYLVRNPLDIAVSFAHHLAVPVDEAIDRLATRDLETEVTGDAVYEVYGSWSQHVESWTRTRHRAVHVMRYEDMLARPVETFGALTRHLLLAPSPDVLETAIALSSFERLSGQETASGFREKPPHAERFFREGRAGQWHHVLTEAQVRRIVVAHRAQMRRFAYLPTDG